MRRHVRGAFDDQYSVEIMPVSKGNTESNNTSRYVCFFIFSLSEYCLMHCIPPAVQRQQSEYRGHRPAEEGHPEDRSMRSRVVEWTWTTPFRTQREVSAPRDDVLALLCAQRRNVQSILYGTRFASGSDLVTCVNIRVYHLLCTREHAMSLHSLGIHAASSRRPPCKVKGTSHQESLNCPSGRQRPGVH